MFKRRIQEQWIETTVVQTILEGVFIAMAFLHPHFVLDSSGIIVMRNEGMSGPSFPEGICWIRRHRWVDERETMFTDEEEDQLRPAEYVGHHYNTWRTAWRRWSILRWEDAPRILYIEFPRLYIRISYNFLKTYELPFWEGVWVLRSNFTRRKFRHIGQIGTHWWIL